MVTLLLDQTQLEVVLSPFERTVTFHRENLRIDRDRIRKVQLTDDPWTWLRGVPSPGAHVPSVLAAGQWKSASGRDFVLIRRRHAGVVIDLDSGEPFERLIITTRHGLALAQALRLEVSDQAADVASIAQTAPITVPKRRPAAKPKTA